MKFRLALGLVLPLPCGLLACSSGSATTATEPHPTIVEIAPQAFPRSLPCGEGAGALRTYVATLTDVPKAGEDRSPFVLPSSAPTSCRQGVAFGNVVPEHRYSAEVHGYDRADLEPVAPGLPALRDPETGEVVAPRWTTRCEAVQAELELTSRILQCEPWSDLSLGEASVTVDIRELLGDLKCGDGPLEIERFEVRLASELLGEADCLETLTVTLPETAATQELEVLAFEAGSESPLLGGRCEARGAAGVTLPARCSPLSRTGAIQFELSELLASIGVECAELWQLVLTLDDPEAAPLKFRNGTCRGSAVFMSVPTGTHTVEVLATDAQGTELVRTQCSASVLPGMAATMACGSAGDRQP